MLKMSSITICQNAARALRPILSELADWSPCRFAEGLWRGEQAWRVRATEGERETAANEYLRGTLGGSSQPIGSHNTLAASNLRDFGAREMLGHDVIRM